MSGRSPVRARTSVDLPEPLAPIRATNSPCVDGQVDVAQDRPAADARRAAVAQHGTAGSVHAGQGIGSPSRARSGSRASATGSPRRRSASLRPSIGSSTAVACRGRAARRLGHLRAAERSEKTVVMPVGCGSGPAAGEVGRGGLGVGGEPGDRLDAQAVLAQVAEGVVGDDDRVARAAGQPVAYAAVERAQLGRAGRRRWPRTRSRVGRGRSREPSATASARSAIRSGSCQKCGSRRRRPVARPSRRSTTSAASRTSPVAFWSTAASTAGWKPLLVDHQVGLRRPRRSRGSSARGRAAPRRAG